MSQIFTTIYSSSMRGQFPTLGRKVAGGFLPKEGKGEKD